jgi:hypothetical protein
VFEKTTEKKKKKKKTKKTKKMRKSGLATESESGRTALDDAELVVIRRVRPI